LISSRVFSASYEAIFDWTFVLPDCASTCDVAKPNKNNVINYIGSVSNNELSNHYISADAFVFAKLEGERITIEQAIALLK
jgi:glycosyltransferase involved in cell wall biosynthesis